MVFYIISLVKQTVVNRLGIRQVKKKIKNYPFAGDIIGLRPDNNIIIIWCACTCRILCRQLTNPIENKLENFANVIIIFTFWQAYTYTQVSLFDKHYKQT